ncbi:hypothetical protein F503_05954 [Ophiostoma piceae UAMH 11346]|uniref:Tat pathway signal sequence domain protein n=1 Tax=Ophiostoma piceae (strain UAMH 11346) TaxID=1262450 RepID=S3CBH9_OPHP1|nr:hypothetical protein F503_05954 [Ophiostoma piceae UAMH 11346]
MASPPHHQPVPVHWLGATPDLNTGTTFGLPWPRGSCAPTTAFTCHDEHGTPVPLQSWQTGLWPDGSMKWSAHALPATTTPASTYRIHSNRNTGSTDVGGKMQHAGARFMSSSEDVGFDAIRVKTSDSFVTVDTGKITVKFVRRGTQIIRQIVASNGTAVGSDGQLVLLTQAVTETADADHDTTPAALKSFEGRVDELYVEQDGPVRAVVVARGAHYDAKATDAETAACLPFVLRFYLYAGSEAIRIVHTLVYDLDEHTTLVRGIGIRFGVPLQGSELYNRHIRFAGAGAGVLAESVQGVTGLWRDPGVEARRAQRHGEPTPSDTHRWDSSFSSLHKWVPAWSDYSLTQLSPDGFTVKKRTKAGSSWVNVSGGTRAGGLAYLGTAETGGLAVGLRNFWERYPTSLDIRGGAENVGEITVWLYSPSADAMDLRPYHDGLGQKTYDDQLDALKITYEDWEEGLGSPYGIARTNELVIFGLAQTPSALDTSRLVELVRSPPQLLSTPEYIYSTAAFGQSWVPFKKLPPPPSSSSDAPHDSAVIQNRLELLFNFYKGQIEQRRWYGFWDHGDVMHTYDADRHTWRYDVGGYAWDNSELSPDLWLWFYFLCTGRQDVFRVAEALTRHTSEVDTYHLGPYKGLGTRHGVQHWSDSCKQARVCNAFYRRIFYFLSGGDERTGELLTEALDGESAFLRIDPYRKVRTDRGLYQPDPEAVNISLGTDWSALAASWIIEWERGGVGAAAAREKLWRSMIGIGGLHNGFVTGLALYNMRTGDVSPPAHDSDNKGVVKVSHLSAMFGLVEVCAELVELMADTEDALVYRRFREAWLDYCQAFNASAEEQTQKYGSSFPNLQLRQGHSRLTAYAAHSLASPALARRAWHEFATGDGYNITTKWVVNTVEPHDNVAPVDEAPWVSTNITALYGLAAIQNLALLKAFT